MCLLDKQSHNPEMRNYIRHPSGIPIQFSAEEDHRTLSRVMNNVGYGGLSFNSNQALEKGTRLHICIDTVTPVFEADGVVVWCEEKNGDYIIGMEFLNKEDTFLARMVEQVCHIEHYKKLVYEKEGRELTSAQAANEWITKFARVFPNP
ncbi:MAG: PilZ domain-containing protein [Gammaproteobacteria bacterium]|nr:PilZ domain-containing protein [Gammaproteobacteria bacterium]